MVFAVKKKHSKNLLHRFKYIANGHHMELLNFPVHSFHQKKKLFLRKSQQRHTQKCVRVYIFILLAYILEIIREKKYHLV